MHDREVLLHRTAARDDGRNVAARQIGELLLSIDEMEETIQAFEETRESWPLPAETDDRYLVRSLERRVAADRAKLRALQDLGAVRYDEIEQAMRVADLMR